MSRNGSPVQMKTVKLAITIYKTKDDKALVLFIK